MDCTVLSASIESPHAASADEIAAARVGPACLHAQDMFCLETITGEKIDVTWLDQAGGYLSESLSSVRVAASQPPWACAAKDARFAVVVIRLRNGGCVRSVVRVER